MTTQPTAPEGARLVLATHNEHKVVELREILADVVRERGLDVDLDRAVVGVDAFPGVEEPVEDGTTFAANALIKAHAVSRATGLPALADDSGLAVDVLGGAPGSFSARWSGRTDLPRAEKDRANLDLLLAQLSDVRDEDRAGGFVCAAALVTPDGTEHVEHGEVRGTIERAPRGTNGFGYDPVLLVDGGRTLAEHSNAEKNAISHRGNALRAIAPRVVDVLVEDVTAR
ncbi:RdgB/HAM1 family non-canonical purine NTP pyrophosphatase [Angustibacter peucedani]